MSNESTFRHYAGRLAVNAERAQSNSIQEISERDPSSQSVSSLGDKYRWSHVPHTPCPEVNYPRGTLAPFRRPPKSSSPTMLKLFSLALAVFSLIIAVQCGGVPACPTEPGGPHPSSLTTRGSICVFKCPTSNVEGNDLSSSIHDSARLNCRYATSSTTGIQAACMYSKVSIRPLQNNPQLISFLSTLANC